MLIRISSIIEQQTQTDRHSDTIYDISYRIKLLTNKKIVEHILTRTKKKLNFNFPYLSLFQFSIRSLSCWLFACLFVA